MSQGPQADQPLEARPGEEIGSPPGTSRRNAAPPTAWFPPSKTCVELLTTEL